MARVDLSRRRQFLAACAAALLARRRAGAQSAAETLVAAIQDGGKIIYLRHAATNHAEVDSGRLGDRAGQRNLSTEGTRQARRLGEALRALRVPLNEILAGPVFRARDTGELAFGADRIRVTDDLVADDYAGDRLQAMILATRGHLITPPPPGQNRILVGHRIPLEMATSRQFPESALPEGAMAVFLPDREPRLIGTITAERLIQSAESRGALPRR